MSGKHLEFLGDRLALDVLLIVVSMVFPNKAGAYLNTQSGDREGRGKAGGQDQPRESNLWEGLRLVM